MSPVARQPGRQFPAERGLGRVSASIRTGALLAELLGAISAGIVAEAVGLRLGIALAPVAGLVAAWYVWRGPVSGRSAAEPASGA